MMENAPSLWELMTNDYWSTTCDLIIQFVALLILVMLLVQYARRKHHTFELSLFSKMCKTNLLIVIIFIVEEIVPLFFFLSKDPAAMDIFRFIGYLFIIPWIILRILMVSLLVQWLLFVEYTLHQSRDIIRRRYKPAMVLFAVAVAIIFICIPIEFWSSAKGGDVPLILTVILITLYIISHAIFLLFLIAAYVLLYQEKKRNRIPAYIRLLPTTLCLLAGVAANTFITITDLALLPLFYAMGLMFADYYMFKRLNNIDPKTGFFNKKYIPKLIRYAEKKKLSGATIISIKAERRDDELAELIKIWEPDTCKTVTMGDGLFLLILDPVKDSVAKHFISLFKQQAESREIPMTADYEIHHNAQ